MMGHLLELRLGGNQLTGLPREISAIVEKSLRLDLHDNPLAEPYPELMTRGTHAILAYLRSLKDAVAQYEAKVVIVGDGEVGKTSLVAALRHEEFVLGRSPTHGIKSENFFFLILSSMRISPCVLGILVVSRSIDNVGAVGAGDTPAVMTSAERAGCGR